MSSWLLTQKNLYHHLAESVLVVMYMELSDNKRYIRVIDEFF